MASHDQPNHAGGPTGEDHRGAFRRRAVHAAGWSAAGLVGLTVAAVATTAVLDAVDRRRVTPPGELVELADGRHLHLQVAGPDGAEGATADGRPTVVLEAGSGGFGASMAWLQRELAAHTAVVAYDRAGYGFSDAATGPHDAASTVADLHEALGVAGLAGPYVLVGHSLGAGYVRVFAAEHPDEVVGLVLLDPVHEEQLALLPDEALDQLDEAQQQLALAPVLARLGVFRLVDPQAAIVAALPEDAGGQHRARSITSAGMRAYGREVAVLADLLDEVGHAEAAASTATGTGQAFGGLPVVIISATEPADGESAAARAVMDTLHRELAERSPAASHRDVAGADHLSLVFDAEHAAEVAGHVSELLDVLTDRAGAEAAG
jgi:pimeloyl-ACP methyl ester carboxylesterase